MVPETGLGRDAAAAHHAELRRRANVVNELAMVIAVAAFGSAALISYLVALWLTSPVRQIFTTAEAVMTGRATKKSPLPPSGTGLRAKSGIR